MELILPEIEDFTSGKVKSLGWSVLNWCTTYLGQPDGKTKGDNWRFTNEQALFVLRLYAIKPNGEFVFNRAILERAKGWGKSPLLAALCCAELLGPVRFSHFDETGQPIGRPEYTPLIQIAAISEDQANNTYYLVMEMLNEGLAYIAYDLKGCVMLSKVHTHDNGIIQKVTASPRGREGQRVTFVVCDETHLWVPAENGPELMDALRRNAVKMDNRIVETTNAPVPGEMSVAEDSHEAVVKQVAGLAAAGVDGSYVKILLDTREVFVEDIYDKEKAFPALRYVYGDAAKDNGGWVNLDRIWDEILDPSCREHMARRFYFNQRISGHTTWLKPHEWKACRDDSIKLKKTDQIALGFKITPSKACVIVACRLTDGALFNLSGKDWERTDGDPEKWEVSATAVDKRIRKLIDDYDVYKVVADQQSFQDIIGRWSIDYEDVIEETSVQNKTKMSRYCEAFESAVVGKRLKYNDDQISRHVLNCHEVETPTGYTIRQETRHTTRYIIGAQAAVLAWEAGILAIEEGAMKSKVGTLYSF